MTTDPPINLRDRRTTVPLTPDAFEDRIKLLFMVRRQIQTYLNTSGEHENLISKYIDNAIKAVKKEDKGASKLHRVAVYYFFIRCEELGDAIDAAFKPFLDDALKGSTHNIGPTVEKKSKKSTVAVLTGMAKAVQDSSNQMIELIKEQSTDLKLYLKRQQRT
jgi:hypothetical protein